MRVAHHPVQLRTKVEQAQIPILENGPPMR